MVSLAMGAVMMGTMYFLWARCAQHGASASGGGLVCVSLQSYRALGFVGAKRDEGEEFRESRLESTFLEKKHKR